MATSEAHASVASIVARRSAPAALTRAIERALARTKNGSRAHAIVKLVADLVIWERRGVTTAEVRATAVRTGALSPTFNAEFYSLVRRGVLEAVGGRSGLTLYAPSDSGVGEGIVEDDGMLVLTALRRAYGRLGRALSTREVAGELTAMGATLASTDINAIRKRLETLARERARGFVGRRRALVRHQRLQSLGRGMTSYWSPMSASDADVGTTPQVATTEHNQPIHPPSEAEALRLAVASASALLQRPVTRQEVQWAVYFEENRSAALPMLPAGRVARALASTLRADSRSRRSGRLREYRSQWTAHGGAATRYSVYTSWVANGVRPAAVEDALYVFAAAREWEGIQRLERYAQQRRVQALLDIAALRRATLRRALYDVLADTPVDEVAAHLERCYRVLDEWVTNGEEHEQRWSTHARRFLMTRSRNLDALQAIAPDLERGMSREHRRILRAGQAGTITPADIEPLIASVARLRHETPQRVQRYIDRARRYPSAEGGRSVGAAGTAPRPLALIDRADALVLLAVTPMPRARTLLTEAVAVTGWVNRDAAHWAAILRDIPRGNGYVRRALVVACGLLALPVPFEVAVPDPENAVDVAAWVFSLAMAFGPSAAPHATEARSALPRGSKRVIDTALMRLRSGYLWTCVE